VKEKARGEPACCGLSEVELGGFDADLLGAIEFGVIHA
jgi:hypothetical protein